MHWPQGHPVEGAAIAARGERSGDSSLDTPSPVVTVPTCSLWELTLPCAVHGVSCCPVSICHSFIKNDDATESLPPPWQELLAADNTDVKARFGKVTSSAQTAQQWGVRLPGLFSLPCLHSVPREPDIHPAGCGPDHSRFSQMTHLTSTVRWPSALSGFGGKRGAPPLPLSTPKAGRQGWIPLVVL